MLLLFGDKYENQLLGMAPIRCPQCHFSPCALFEIRKKLTIYFIPTVGMGTDYVLKCGNCARQWEVSKEQAEQLRARLLPSTTAQAGSATTVRSPGGNPRSGSAPAGSRFCGQCGKPAPPGAAFCQQCGTVLESMRACGSCGQTTTGRYCSHCGAATPP